MGQDRIGFVGLGGMGTAITKTLIKSGRLGSELLVWNRTQAKADSLIAEVGADKARYMQLDGLVTATDIVWTILKDDKAVQEVYDVLLASDTTGKVFVDSSSIPGPVSNALAERTEKSGGLFLSMPVFGDPSVAAAAGLICVPAGPTEAIQRIQPYLVGGVAKAVVDLPDRPASDASTIKLIGNTLILNSMNSIAEALVFADKAGVGSASMGQLIATLFPLPPHAVYLKKMLSDEYHSGAPAVPVPMAIALAKIVLGMAERVGASVPAYSTAVGHLQAVEKNHEGQTKDITSLYGAVRVQSGLPFKTD